MAERRMLAKSIIESDMFSNMPLDAQMLYIRLNLSADDDGFVSNPRSVMRMCGASDDCMRILVSKKFVLSFEVGDDFVFLIKHWKVHNLIRSDRYKASTFKNLLREVYYDENKAYSLTPGEDKTPCLPPVVSEQDTNGIPAVYQTGDEVETQDSIGKVSIDKGSLEEDRENNNLYTHDEYINDDPVKTWGDRILFNMEKGLGVDGLISLAELRGVTREQLRKYVGDKKKEGKKT